MITKTEGPESVGPSERPRWWQRYHWLPLVLPLAVYMLAGQVESWVMGRPAAENPAAVEPGGAANQTDTASEAEVRAAEPDSRYALAYTGRIVLTLAAVVLVIPYYRTVPLKVHRLSLSFGLVGGVIWILVCRQHWEQYAASALGLGDWMVSGQRAAFDPLTTFDGRPLWLGCFLAVRFLGLVALVPLIEEFFLRGFLMRFFRQADWWVIPWGDVTVGSALIATAYGVLSHPAEAFAAAIWFTWITLLYVRTRSIWDCVLAHALTNLVLGIYVLAWRDWSLW